MSREMTQAERRLAYLGREMQALGPHASNEQVSGHLGRVGNMLTMVGDTVSFDDFDELDMALISAIAQVSNSGVEF